MGFLSAYNGTRRIQIGDPELGYWVDLKQYISQGDQEEAEAALTKISVKDNGTTEVKPDVARYRKLMVKAAIADWNLDDDNGQIWAVNLQNVHRLPLSVFNEIWAQVNAQTKSRTVEEQATFRERSVSSDQDGDTA